MIIPNFQESIGKYNIRKYEEHAYRTTIYIAKHRLLVLERRNNSFALEIVDNSQKKWHTIEEFEFFTEEALLSATHDYLFTNCGYTNTKLTR